MPQETTTITFTKQDIAKLIAKAYDLDLSTVKVTIISDNYSDPREKLSDDVLKVEGKKLNYPNGNYWN